MDEIAKLGKVLPGHWSKNNPIDIIGDASYERYLKTLEIADSFNADAIYVLVTPQFMTNPRQICKLFIEHNFKTKMFPVLLGGEMMQAARNLSEENKINYFEELTEAVSFL